MNFIRADDFAAVEAAINGTTRLLFVEAVGNPALDVADRDGYAARVPQSPAPWRGPLPCHGARNRFSRARECGRLPAP